MLVALSGMMLGSLAVPCSKSFHVFFLLRLVVGFFAGGTSALVLEISAIGLFISLSFIYSLIFLTDERV